MKPPKLGPGKGGLIIYMTLGKTTWFDSPRQIACKAQVTSPQKMKYDIIYPHRNCFLSRNFQIVSHITVWSDLSDRMLWNSINTPHQSYQRFLAWQIPAVYQSMCHDSKRLHRQNVAVIKMHTVLYVYLYIYIFSTYLLYVYRYMLYLHRLCLFLWTETWKHLPNLRRYHLPNLERIDGSHAFRSCAWSNAFQPGLLGTEPWRDGKSEDCTDCTPEIS